MKESKIFSNQNLTEKVHYVYRVTIDEKYYIGKRSGFLNDLHTGRYKTSSNLVHEKLQNGMTFSKIKILQVFSTEKEAYEYEKRILLRVDARRNPKFLNQHNGNGNYTLKRHTQKSKEKMSEKTKAQFDSNTEYGRKQRENKSQSAKAQFDSNTEYGIKQREIQSEKGIERFNPNTEEGLKRRENHSEKMKEYYNPETKQGLKRRENKSQSAKAQFDKNTEQGRKRREDQSNKRKEYFNPDTEEGQKNREIQSKK